MPNVAAQGPLDAITNIDDLRELCKESFLVVEHLRKALAPFVNEANRTLQSGSELDDDTVIDDTKLTYGDLRRAREMSTGLAKPAFNAKDALEEIKERIEATAYSVNLIDCKPRCGPVVALNDIHSLVTTHLSKVK